MNNIINEKAIEHVNSIIKGIGKQIGLVNGEFCIYEMHSINTPKTPPIERVSETILFDVYEKFEKIFNKIIKSNNKIKIRNNIDFDNYTLEHNEPFFEKSKTFKIKGKEYINLSFNKINSLHSLIIYTLCIFKTKEVIENTFQINDNILSKKNKFNIGDFVNINNKPPQDVYIVVDIKEPCYQKPMFEYRVIKNLKEVKLFTDEKPQELKENSLKLSRTGKIKSI